MLEQFRRDLQLSLRRLAATPIFTLFAVVSLAIGVGATTAFYASVYEVIWPAGGIRDLSRVFYVTASTPGGRTDSRFNLARGDFDELRAAGGTLSEVAAWVPTARPYIDGSVAQIFTLEAVTGNAFAVGGVRLARGRGVQAPDDDLAADPVLVVSHTFWQRKLGGAADVVGRTVLLGGRPFQIVGIADRAFQGFGAPHIGAGANGWIPLSALAVLSSTPPSALQRDNHDIQSLSAFGRLRPGGSVGDVAAALSVVGQRLDGVYPLKQRLPGATDSTVRPRRWSAMLVRDSIAAQYSTGMPVVLVALVGLVLVVACTNLANLTLARGSARLHEFAVRRALGGSRWRLIREQILESAILALVGGLVSALVARLILVAAAAQVPVGFDMEIATDLRPGVVAALVVAVFLTLLVFGLWPALQVTRPDVRGALAADTGAVRWRTRRGLISLQVGVSAAFLFVAAMFVQTVASDWQTDSGVDIDRIATASVSFQLHQMDEARARVAMDRILDAARQEPSIEIAAISSGFPFGMGSLQASISTTDHPILTNTDGMNTYYVAGTPEIFRTLNLSLLRGRLFDAHDDAAAAPAVVIDAHNARALFGTVDAVGRQLLLRFYDRSSRGADSSQTLTVAGVVRDTDVGSIGQRRTGVIYLPLAQHYESNVWLVARSPVDAAAVAGTLRSIIRQADPMLAVGISGSGTYLLGGQHVVVRLLAGAAAILGGLALFLSMTGLYGVLSHVVERRTREMGVRLALGATSGRLVRMVIADGSRPVVVGLIIGLVGGTLGRAIFRMIVARPVTVVDPLAMALVPIPLAIAALVATWLPARRASRVDPNVALRDL
ncbi:MAG TPA: ABC transporter permease [Vicinamibacterales bacterium]|nr:ABC transporter permease [Vicinamibacterales bacterium]